MKTVNAKKNVLLRNLVAVAFFVSSPIGMAAEPFQIQGRVVGISDGDTLTVLDNRSQQHKIRLAEIDAPEKAQDFGERSKQHLSDLVFGKEVVVTVIDTDRYQRKVGEVTTGTISANHEQVKAGLAWVYRRYANDLRLYRYETAAREQKLGLWSLPSPTPPWEFRKR